MKHIKKVLYIHGYNSSGSTGKMLKRTMKEKYGDVEVIAPEIPANYHMAKEVVDQIMEKEKPDLVMGTSLGGFMTLSIQTPLRLAINPTLYPSKTLPLIGVEEDISDSYKKIEQQIKDLLDYEDRLTVYGAFGDNDKVVNFKKEFSDRYLKDHIITIPGGEHQIKEDEYKKYIFPLIEKIDLEIDNLSDQIETMSSLGIS